MKKIIILVIMLTNIFTLSGCPIDTQDLREYNPHEYNPKQEALYNEETLKEILECFDNKDADALVDIFSASVKSEYDLNCQIEKAFEIYGEKAISYEKFNDFGETSLTRKDGICIQKNIGAEMINIQINNDEIFNISFIKCVVDDDNPNELGIKTIYLSSPIYGHLAIIGYVQDFQLKMLEENNKKRNSSTSAAED